MKVETLTDCDGNEIKVGSMIAFYQGKERYGNDRDFENAEFFAGVVYEMWDHPIFGQRMSVRVVDENGNPIGYEVVSPGCALAVNQDNAYFAGFILRRAGRVNVPADDTIPNAD